MAAQSNNSLAILAFAEVLVSSLRESTPDATEEQLAELRKEPIEIAQALDFPVELVALGLLSLKFDEFKRLIPALSKFNKLRPGSKTF